MHQKIIIYHFAIIGDIQAMLVLYIGCNKCAMLLPAKKRCGQKMQKTLLFLNYTSENPNNRTGQHKICGTKSGILSTHI